jgi:hypothetical protein
MTWQHNPINASAHQHRYCAVVLHTAWCHATQAGCHLLVGGGGRDLVVWRAMELMVSVPPKNILEQA